MKKQLVIAFVSLCFICSCSKSSNVPHQKNTDHQLPTNETADIPFEIASHYFIKNTAYNKDLTSTVISDSIKFDSIFGVAAVMGPGGVPKPIDFKTKFVVALIDAESDRSPSFDILTIEKDQKGEVIVNYEYNQSEEKQSFTTRPCSIIVLDKKQEGNVIFNRLNQ